MSALMEMLAQLETAQGQGPTPPVETVETVDTIAVTPADAPSAAPPASLVRNVRALFHGSYDIPDTQRIEQAREAVRAALDGQMLKQHRCVALVVVRLAASDAAFGSVIQPIRLSQWRTAYARMLAIAQEEGGGAIARAAEEFVRDGFPTPRSYRQALGFMAPPSETMPWTGAGTRLSVKMFEHAAAQLGCDVPAVMAVARKEAGVAMRGVSKSAPKRVLVRTEAHIFSGQTGHEYDDTHPHLSARSFNRRLAPSSQSRCFDYVSQMYALDSEAALKSCSWGMFQIMGFNHALCGYSTVRDMVEAFAAREDAQLDAFVAFVTNTGLARHMRSHDWQSFARGYNGPAFASNNYDADLQRLYREYAKAEPYVVLEMGDVGNAVSRLQSALSSSGYDCTPDGAFGDETRRQLVAFQTASGLPADGIAGARTWSVLDIPPSGAAAAPAPETPADPATEKAKGAAGATVTITGVLLAFWEQVIGFFTELGKLPGEIAGPLINGIAESGVDLATNLYVVSPLALLALVYAQWRWRVIPFPREWMS